MAARAPPAAAAAAQERPSVFSQVIKFGGMFMAMQFVMSKVMPKPAVPTPSNAPSTPGSPAAPAQPAQQQNAVPAWPADAPLALHVYLSDGQLDFSHPKLPYVLFEGFTTGDTKFAPKSWETTFATPEAVKHNASLWAELFLTKNGASPDPRSPSYSRRDILHTRKLLTRYHQLKKQRVTKNLFSDAPQSDKEAEVEEAPSVIGSHWHQNLTLTLVNDDAKKPVLIPYGQLPPPLRQFVHLDGSASAFDPATAGKLRYLPVLYPNDFWLMREHMHPINSTVDELKLRIDFHPLSYFKFQMYASLDDAFGKQAATGGGGEIDEIKHMLTQTNPILLATTILVSLLHTVFEFLAFKSDVGHWRNKKELVGVSVRTIITNVVVQLLIMLYLLDNNENTSWMILGGQGIGLLIEAWKITKAVDIKLVPATSGILPYRVEIKDKHVLTEEEKKTQEYDKLAFRYVSSACAPLLVGYTIYSAVYETHRGWYSFVISTLVSFVYAFGLIINWKLKSVAHMPMKSLTYKALNTVVDDFFSFVIRMPWLHRLACFRDDVVFVILLYQVRAAQRSSKYTAEQPQYWIYPVDHSRANEYGQVEEEPKRVDGTTDTAAKDKAKAITAETRKDR